MLLVLLMALSSLSGLGQALAEEEKVTLIYYSWEDENDYIIPICDRFCTNLADLFPPGCVALRST